MKKTVIALYDDYDSAIEALKELVDRGISDESICFMANDVRGEFRQFVGTGEVVVPAQVMMNCMDADDRIGFLVSSMHSYAMGPGVMSVSGIGPVLAAGQVKAMLMGKPRGLIAALVDMGIPDQSARNYAEGLRRGGTLLAVQTTEEKTGDVVDILNHYSPVDLNQRVSLWRERGWEDFSEDAQPLDENQLWPRSKYRSEEQVASEEQERILYPREQYRPEGERAEDAAEQDLWPRDEYRLEEEKVSAKTEHEIYPRDQYRHESANTGRSDFMVFDTMFRSHFEDETSKGDMPYDQYIPAYRFGYDLARMATFKDENSWSDVEPEARRLWEGQNPGTWDRYKDAVRHAWEAVSEPVH